MDRGTLRSGWPGQQRGLSEQVSQSCLLVGRLRPQAVAAGYTALAIGIGLDHTGIDGEAFASDKSLGHAATNPVSNTSRSKSASRKRPCQALEKVEWSGTTASRLSEGERTMLQGALSGYPSIPS
jgi:hypothetical protein